MASPAFDSALRKVSLVESASAGTAAALRQHNADYGFDGSFHTVPPRAQALLLGASCPALMTTAGGVDRPNPERPYRRYRVALRLDTSHTA